MDDIKVRWDYRIAKYNHRDEDEPIIVRVLFIGQVGNGIESSISASIEMPDGSVREVDHTRLTFVDNDAADLRKINQTIEDRYKK